MQAVENETNLLRTAEIRDQSNRSTVGRLNLKVRNKDVCGGEHLFFVICVKIPGQVFFYLIGL
jgi:hypothetical protein